MSLLFLPVSFFSKLLDALFFFSHGLLLQLLLIVSISPSDTLGKVLRVFALLSSDMGPEAHRLAENASGLCSSSRAELLRILLELGAKVVRKVHFDRSDSDGTSSIIIHHKRCYFSHLWVGNTVLYKVATLKGSHVPWVLQGLLASGSHTHHRQVFGLLVSSLYLEAQLDVFRCGQSDAKCRKVYDKLDAILADALYSFEHIIKRIILIYYYNYFQFH